MDAVSPWTPALEVRLAALWLSGMRTKRIGNELGMSKSSIISKAKRLALPLRASPIIRALPISDQGLARRKNSEAPERVRKTSLPARDVEEHLAHQKPVKRRWSVAQGVARAEQRIRVENGKDHIPGGMKRSAVSVAGLRHRKCQWIEDKPSANESCKCLRPTTVASYCAEHETRARWIPRLEVAAFKAGEGAI